VALDEALDVADADVLSWVVVRQRRKEGRRSGTAFFRERGS
jgi:hypothetical protein